MLEITQDEGDIGIQISYWQPDLSEDMVTKLASDLIVIFQRVNDDVNQTIGELLVGLID